MSTRSQRKKRFDYRDPPQFLTLTFLVFVVARYMQWGARRDIFATLRIEFVLGLVLTVACVLLLPSSPLRLNRVPSAKRVVAGIGLLFFAMIIQLPFAADKELAQSIFVDRVIKFAMLTLFIVVLVRSPRTMRWFIASFLFACFYVTQEAARGALSGSLIWENQGIPRLHGAVPIYKHPNSLAGVAMGVLPFVVFLFPVVQRVWVRALLLLPLMTASVCLLYSGSRTGYVAFLTFLVFWWTQSNHKIRWAGLGLTIALVMFPVLPNEYVERFKSIGGSEAEGNSKEKRIEILEDAFIILGENPMGVGVASFPAVREGRFGRSQDTHNLYLEVATNLGVQGFIVFVFLLTSMWACIRSTRSRLRRLRSNLERLLRPGHKPQQHKTYAISNLLHDLAFLEATCSAFMGFLFVRLTLGMFGMDLYEPYWWFVAGTTISLAVLSISISRAVKSMLDA